MSFRVDVGGVVAGGADDEVRASHVHARRGDRGDIDTERHHDDRHDRDRDQRDDLARDDDEDRDGAKDFHHRARGAIGGARERDARADR